MMDAMRAHVHPMTQPDGHDAPEFNGELIGEIDGLGPSGIRAFA
jgi:hypothetical protein